MSKNLLFLVFLLLVSGNTFANAKLDAEADKARKKQGTKVLKCSPKGGADTISFEQAMKELRPGMTLQFAPGFYNIGELSVFTQNNVIFEGDGSGGFVDIFLYCYGQDVIVRNMNLHTMDIGDGTVVDCKVYSIVTTNPGKGVKTYLYNVGCIWLHTYINKSDLYMKHCTVSNAMIVKEEGEVYQRLAYTTHGYGGYSVFNFGGVEGAGSELQIYNSIINSNYYTFSRPPMDAADPKKKKPFIELTIEDSIVYGAKSLVSLGKDDPPVKDIKGFEEFFKVKKSQNVLMIQPKFIKDPDTKSWWNVKCENYVLADGAQGKKEAMGVIAVGEKDMPSTAPAKK